MFITDENSLTHSAELHLKCIFRLPAFRWTVYLSSPPKEHSPPPKKHQMSQVVKCVSASRKRKRHWYVRHCPFLETEFMLSCGSFWTVYCLRQCGQGQCSQYWWRGSNHRGFGGTAVLFWSYWFFACMPLAMLDEWGRNFNPVNVFLWRVMELPQQPQWHTHSKCLTV